MDTEPVCTFKFVEFNPRRKMRGVEAVRMQCFEDGELVALLWMSIKDIQNNIKDFGDSEELQKGLAAYKGKLVEA